METFCRTTQFCSAFIWLPRKTDAVQTASAAPANEVILIGRETNCCGGLALVVVMEGVELFCGHYSTVEISYLADNRVNIFL
jgi:hypothetical protein